MLPIRFRISSNISDKKIAHTRSLVSNGSGFNPVLLLNYNCLIETKEKQTITKINEFAEFIISVIYIN